MKLIEGDFGDFSVNKAKRSEKVLPQGSYLLAMYLHHAELFIVLE